MMNHNNKLINVATGEVKFACCGQELVSHGIGSCIVMTIYDPQKKTGAMLHIMLPGKAPSNEKYKTKYAFDAIEEAISEFTRREIQVEPLQICLIGGGNVLKDNNDRICQNNIHSVNTILESKKIRVMKKDLGGTGRRTARMILRTGDVYYSVNGYPEEPLYISDDN